jgi:hypothetical protein
VKDAKNQIIVYAGAADGRHTPFLTELYPEMEFHLYDPRPFNFRVLKTKGIKVNPFSSNGFFTDEVAQQYVGKNVWFISDIRTKPTEDEIASNQAAQMRWVEIMGCKRFMLKYKLPYPMVGKPIEYEYLDGDIRLQCWPPIKSAETRLISKDDEPRRYKKYNILKYERQLSWWNNVARLNDFGSRSLRDFGVSLDKTVEEFWSHWAPTVIKGFDFIYELQILQKYTTQKYAVIKDLHKFVEKINRILLDKNETFESRLRHSKLEIPIE